MMWYKNGMYFQIYPLLILKYIVRGDWKVYLKRITLIKEEECKVGKEPTGRLSGLMWPGGGGPQPRGFRFKL